VGSFDPFGFIATRELPRFIHLPSAAMVAMEAGGGKVVQLVRAPVHAGLLVLDSGTGGTIRRERTLAVAALSVLVPDQLIAYPLTIRTVIAEARHIPASYLSLPGRKIEEFPVARQ
jgi:hypothetical protein